MNKEPDVSQPANRPGTLYLIPVPLTEAEQPVAWADPKVKDLRFFIVEKAKTARRMLRKMGFTASFDETIIFEPDKHRPNEGWQEMLAPLLEGHDMGLMSEAGCPGIADPGSSLVQKAHRAGAKVVPLIGPTSVFLALMASGLNGQHFVFHGYLPIPSTERTAMLRKLETQARKTRQTHIFIETPFRNDALLKDLLPALQPDTLLCIACNLTAADEFIRTMPVSQWRKQPFCPGKRPTVFLIGV